MQVLLTIATLFGLTAVFSYINERFLKLQQTIGLMLMALALTLVLMLLNLLSLSEYFAQEQEFVARLSLDETLLNGVLCFMLFAGSINVKLRVLGEERWVILTLAVGATLVGAAIAFLGVWVLADPTGGGQGDQIIFSIRQMIDLTDPSGYYATGSELFVLAAVEDQGQIGDLLRKCGAEKSALEKAIDVLRRLTPGR